MVVITSLAVTSKSLGEAGKAEKIKTARRGDSRLRMPLAT
jgi:hypothetical protein